MNTVLSQHPYLISAAIAVGTWLFNNIVSVMITSLPAPTKDSTAKYIYWFKVLNTVIGNLKRAQASHVEDSPNWQAAVQKHIETNGFTAPDAAPVPQAGTDHGP